jgi:hypothetical protein
VEKVKSVHWKDGIKHEHGLQTPLRPGKEFFFSFTTSSTTRIVSSGGQTNKYLYVLFGACAENDALPLPPPTQYVVNEVKVCRKH